MSAAPAAIAVATASRRPITGPVMASFGPPPVTPDDPKMRSCQAFVWKRSSGRKVTKSLGGNALDGAPVLDGKGSRPEFGPPA